VIRNSVRELILSYRNYTEVVVNDNILNFILKNRFCDFLLADNTELDVVNIADVPIYSPKYFTQDEILYSIIPVENWQVKDLWKIKKEQVDLLTYYKHLFNSPAQKICLIFWATDYDRFNTNPLVGFTSVFTVEFTDFNSQLTRDYVINKLTEKIEQIKKLLLEEKLPLCDENYTKKGKRCSVCMVNRFCDQYLQQQQQNKNLPVDVTKAKKTQTIVINNYTNNPQQKQMNTQASRLQQQQQNKNLSIKVLNVENTQTTVESNNANIKTQQVRNSQVLKTKQVETTVQPTTTVTDQETVCY
jgi:hypothetical protein